MSQPALSDRDPREEIRQIIVQLGHPALTKLVEQNVTPRVVEAVSDPATLVSLSRAVADYTKQALRYWEPLLNSYLDGKTTAPLEDLLLCADFLRACGAGLAIHLDLPDCADALTRLQQAMLSLKPYLPREDDEEGGGPALPQKKGMVQSAYNIPAVPASRSAVTSRKRSRDDDRPRKGLGGMAWALIFSIVLAVGARVVDHFLHRPQIKEEPVSEYVDTLPMLSDKMIDASGTLLLTVWDTWPNQPYEERLNQVLAITEATGNEGWWRLVIADQQGRMLAHVETDGSIEVVKRADE